MLTIVMGLLLGLLIGAGCRWFEIPMPSPPTLVGILLVVAMTVGYTFTDRFLAKWVVDDQASLRQPHCGFQ